MSKIAFPARPVDAGVLRDGRPAANDEASILAPAKINCKHFFHIRREFFLAFGFALPYLASRKEVHNMSTAAFAVAIIVIIFVATIGLAGVLLIGMGLRAEGGKEAEK